REGPVDEAGDQRLLLGGPPFALEMAAGNAAGGVGLFLVVAGQRQEIDARLGFLGGDDGRQDRRLAVGRDNGPVGLSRYLAGLEDELTPTPIELLTMNVEHSSLLSWFSDDCESHDQGGGRLRAASPDAASGDPAMAFEPSC